MNNFPQALTIAGSDSGGGAGMQADIKTIQERDVFATNVVVAITAQNTIGVQDSFPLPLELVTKQFESLAADFKIRACKTGMLADAEHVAVVAQNLRRFDFGPLTLDPVMIAKGGASLLADSAIDTLRSELLPLATVLTPNLPEAEVLTGQKIQTTADFKTAATQLQKMGAKNIIIKGGHLDNSDQACDYVLYADGSDDWLNTPRIATVRTHGTGDTFSACLTAELAKQVPLKKAIQISKAFIQAAIANPIAVGHGHGPTNHWAYQEVEHD
ncbi:bifunctional hydroxymethylpyrimidine kinase/phosphomethylpyrimidine kinase [Latilactobacillus sakei]|jgi:hydroxymethylpyrimidine/phosphomethylpyrimidine kinase|uniref:bifunctional hydroxymethylpyrimidine kinase/phosphomethylpyrimidine kinase n=1 Tax=Latilactobacillus sakei TaxID=1599 RepID=UPI00077C8329|nr:bifunctional hydroxymethylpyrimidine kinase/phosphomethylpyrimidine kinase [Latilactobacillus sakei]AST84462.1 bifunctional hydroxymethylpyrimidine kinase/phosphomethylpyrimidine kinase [Latilactobacillus sakei]AWZ42411.1 bifunctional hydroxymethylpyrimidine kinase/phosphomethylpyrimidine kinase [Latilactobacillus sakei]AWZ45129.1 bifunctional hydroxymethylpyrimidine kinase/phosphomethylpyrimidine kinase [Latilactobacillus sakei]AWZ46419.1 bifunctional hydroxymethylpyrimidine kinase/phosphom